LKNSSRLVPAGIAISLYAAWNARDLLMAWLHSPYDRFGYIAFLLWMLPVGCVWFTRHIFGLAVHGHVRAGALAIGLAVSFAGVILDVNAIKYLGLAITISGFLPLQPATYVWLACALGWMPAAGWALSSHAAVLVNCIRIVIGMIALFSTPSFLRHESNH